MLLIFVCGLSGVSCHSLRECPVTLLPLFMPTRFEFFLRFVFQCRDQGSSVCHICIKGFGCVPVCSLFVSVRHRQPRIQLRSKHTWGFSYWLVPAVFQCTPGCLPVSYFIILSHQPLHNTHPDLCRLPICLYSNVSHCFPYVP